MFSLKITSHFAAAHQLRGLQGGCENLHGHNWKVEVEVAGSRLAEDGMLMDFRDLKAATKQVLDRLDHRFLNELPQFTDYSPSSENIARLIFRALRDRFTEKGVEVTRVTAWESETASASYSEP